MLAIEQVMTGNMFICDSLVLHTFQAALHASQSTEIILSIDTRHILRLTLEISGVVNFNAPKTLDQISTPFEELVFYVLQ